MYAESNSFLKRKEKENREKREKKKKKPECINITESSHIVF